jgi:cob(I)alamin adenosyltransferase
MGTNERAAKIYTRTGDKGKTSLVSGTRVSKAHLRLDTYGTVDELNSVIGVLRVEAAGELGKHTELGSLDQFLHEIQNDLFNVGSQLACEDAAMRGQLPNIGPDTVAHLEEKMDEFSALLAPLKNFIIPGGSRSAAFAHVARTVCRRAERLCVALAEAGEEIDPVLVQYLNRLSDFMFVLARHLNRLMGVSEPTWAPKK